MKLNLFDDEFRHLKISVHDKDSNKIEYIRDQLNWNGITIFTDRNLRQDLIKAVNSKIKIGWLLENRQNTLMDATARYESFENYKDLLDFTMTHDSKLLAQFPNKTKFIPFGGCWIPETQYQIHQKTKSVSMIYSTKKSTLGHQFRHAAALRFKHLIDLYGTGTGVRLSRKEEGLKKYRFSVVTENCKAENYFTEKLLDCFAVGTIPIYWGCPNIKDFFDPEGILHFTNLKELESILTSLADEDYDRRAKAVKSNFQSFQQYAITEDWMYENILKGVL